MKAVYMKRFYLIVFLFLFVQEAFAANLGKVKLNNYTDMTLIIWVQTVDYYGYKQWREAGRLSGRTYLVLEQVPNGTVIGAQTENKEITFEPMQVRFPEYSDFYEIDYR